MRLEEPHRALVPAQRRQLARELLIDGEVRSRGGGRRGRLRGRTGRGLCRCRSGLRHQNERKQANE